MEGIRNLDEEWKEERDRARREGGRRRGRGNRSAACGGYHVGDAIAMPFANINFSELIKIVYIFSRYTNTNSDDGGVIVSDGAIV